MAIVLDGTTGITTPDLTDTSLTSGRVVYAGTSGNLTGSTALTYNGTDLQFASGSGLFTNTSDGSDTATLAIGGGGANSSARGSIIEFYGNENASAGVLDITSGNVANSYVRIQGRSSTSYIRFDTNTTERMRVDSSGNVGIGTSSPTTRLHLSQSNAGGYASVILLSNSADAGADRTGIYGSAAPGNGVPYRGGITFHPGATGGVSIHTGNNASPSTGQTAYFYSNLTAQFTTSISVGAASPSTSGAGITFPATQSASSDANTLDDYEEGTWTPSDGSGAGLSFTTTFATYTKIGRLVTCSAKIVYPTTGSTAQSQINGLPFTSSSNNHGISTMLTDSGTYLSNIVPESVAYLYPYNLTATRLTNVNLTGKLLIFTISYIV